MEVQPQHAGQEAAVEILHPVINPVTFWIIPQNAKNILNEHFIKDSEQTPQLKKWIVLQSCWSIFFLIFDSTFVITTGRKTNQKFNYSYIIFKVHVFFI